LTDSTFLAVLTVGDSGVAERAGVVISDVVLVSAVETPSTTAAVFLASDAVGDSG